MNGSNRNAENGIPPKNPYDDIINHPHHVSENHPQMSLHARAAQFSPFAALVGYEDAVDRTTRKTEAYWEKEIPRPSNCDDFGDDTFPPLQDD